MVFSMQDFLTFILQRIWGIIIVVLLGAVVGLGGTFYFIEPSFNVSFSMYVYNNTGRTDSESISIGDLNASQSLLNTYSAILTSDSLMEDVVDDLPQYSLTTGQLKSSITTSPVNSTELLKVTVTRESADEALDISQSLQDLAPAFITKVVKAGSVEILDSGTIAHPTSRPILKYTIYGGVGGLMIAVAFLLALFILDTRIWDETDLMERFDIPIVGIIPYDFTGEKNRETNIDELIISSNMPFVISEAYRAARVNLMKEKRPGKCEVFVVTSSKPEEGKTLSAINIAMSLAQNNCNVLLIDMDLRKPQVRNYLHIKDNPSFIDYIYERAEYFDVVRFEDMPLNVLATSTSYSYPSELLSTPRVKDMFARLREHFDFIIIDTPPLEYVIDAAVLSETVDGYILVSRAGFSRIGQIENTVRRLEQLNAHIIGFFLRNVDPKQSGIGSRYHIYNYAEKYEPYYR